MHVFGAHTERVKIGVAGCGGGGRARLVREVESPHTCVKSTIATERMYGRRGRRPSASGSIITGGARGGGLGTRHAGYLASREVLSEACLTNWRALISLVQNDNIDIIVDRVGCR